ncbi:outer membrane beta-barrel protein [Mucilaginibacter sp. JRF]|uniref:outer membrane beta-barrel protein n=1 Tax=Mucilaginibacter sp. JRF TaxID=2780088 RepID=UPI0018823AE9|nr:outer membrane beta-barrel protein [Mucilaginibacter sp. JRF]MBE9584692.1 outer membrane beta-barrel protein [Mucilaginibacter sp. JRF]
MKPTFLSLLCCLLFFTTASAQNKATLKGTVIDSASNTALEHATVTVIDVKDSSMVAYTLSRANGGFELSGLPLNRDVKLLVTFVTYKSFRKNFNFTTGGVTDVGKIIMAGSMMEEVVIKGERVPIVMKKDTIEFNAEAFKTRPNAMLEELLKKIPGMQVNKDGSFTVNGKTVSKLLIDGKEFFGNDPKIATKNLDASIVDKVQVYDDRENDPDHLVSEVNVNKIVNIKLKRAIKRSIFGKVYTGGGSRDRYETGGLFNMFRDTLQLSVIAMSNNLNKTGFSSQELYSNGGFDRSGGDALWNGSVQLGGRGWGGIEKVTSSGFNLNGDYGKKLKLNLMYFYNETRNINQSSNFVEQYIRDTTLFSRNAYGSESKSFGHNINGLVEWKPDTVNSLTYRPNLSFNNNSSDNSSNGNSYNSFNARVNDNESKGTNSGNSSTFGHSLIYNRRGKKRREESFTLTHNLSFNPNKTDGFNMNRTTSYVSTVPSFLLDRYNTSDNKNSSGSLSLSYRYPLSKKLVVDVVTSADYNNADQNQFVYDRDTLTNRYSILLPDQSADLNRRTWTKNVKPGVTWRMSKKISIIAGVTQQWQNLTDVFDVGTVKRSYSFLMPTLRLELFDRISISMDKGYNLPSISDLRPVTIVYSPQSSFIGNPGLEPSSNTRFTLNYYNYNFEKGLNMYAWFNYSVTQNTVIHKSTITSNSVHTTTPVNAGQSVNMYGSFSFGKEFKKSKIWRFGLRSSAGPNYRERINMINDESGKERNWTATFTQGGDVAWNDQIEFNTNVTYFRNWTRYDYASGQSQNLKGFTMQNNINVRWPKKVVWEGKQEFTYNSQIADGFRKSNNILSASVALQMFKKEQGEIKLAVYDLLDQNINIYRFTTTNALIDGQNNTLKRYFLLTYTYKFNVLKTK